MALDKEFFSSIELKLQKKRFYDVSDVDRLLVNIRAQADEMTKRIAQLESENEKLRAGNEDFRTKGIALSREIVALRGKVKELEARKPAKEPASPAPEKQKQETVKDPEPGTAETGYAIEKVEQMVSEMKQMHLRGIEQLNQMWQEFLCNCTENEIAPTDISHKIGAIAKEIREMDNE